MFFCCNWREKYSYAENESILDTLPFLFDYGFECLDIPGEGGSVDDVFIIDVLSIDEFIIELFASLSLNWSLLDEKLALILPFHPLARGVPNSFPDLKVVGVNSTGEIDLSFFFSALEVDDVLVLVVLVGVDEVMLVE